MLRLGLRGALLVWIILLCGIWSGLSAEEPLSTTVVGFQLNGTKPSQRVRLGDLDIIMLNDTIRYMPLAHILRELGLDAVSSGDFWGVSDSLRFPFKVNPQSQTLSRPGRSDQILDMLSGVSDVTGKFELFLRESEIDSLLDIRIEWDEQYFQYWCTTRAMFPVWADTESRKRRRAGERPRIGLDLPLMEETGPSKHGDPSLHFLQIGGRVAVTNADLVRSQRLLNGYGRLAGGRFVTRLRQSTNELSEQPTLERVSLTHRLGDIETSIGDVSLSMSDLVFPSISTFGGMATGYFGLNQNEREEDRTDFGRLDNYASGERIHGSAQVGSNVELYINESWSAETTITEETWEGSGYGTYDFRDVSVTRDRVSDLRVVISAPDGTKTERIIRPAGTNALMPTGDHALTGMGGQRRFATGDFFNTQGQIGAARWMTGVTPFLTLGGVAAYQDRYSFVSDLSSTQASTFATNLPPRESEHAAGLMRVRFFKKNLWVTDASLNRSKFDSTLLQDSTLSLLPYDQVQWGDNAFAVRSTLETYWGNRLKISPTYFYYDPAYFNGINSEIKDRRGFAVQSRLEFSRSFRLNITHGEIENDLDRTQTLAVKQTWDHAEVPLPRFITGLGIRLAADHLRTQSDFKSETVSPTDVSGYLGTADLKLATRAFDAQALVSTGDELQPRQEEDLLRGFQLPNSTTSTRPGWSAQVSRKLLKDGNLSLNHSKQDFRELSRLSHTLRASDKNHWVWRIDAGYDWRLFNWTLQAQPEYYFDRAGTTKISALARYLDNDFVWQIGIRFEPTLSFVGGRPLFVPNSKVNPTNGGIKGKVFADQNGNGKMDTKEPGVPGVEVISDMGRRAVSGKHGEFLIAGSVQKRRTRVALDSKKLPIEFTAFGGQQWVNMVPGNLTPVRLSVARLGAISGFVYRPDPDDTTVIKSVGGTRVVAKNLNGEIVQESVTIDDGSFYIGDLKPGDYIVGIDGATIPRDCSAPPTSNPIAVRDDSAGGLEVANINFTLYYTP